MAEAVLIGGAAVGAGLGEVLSKLTDAIIHVIKKTSNFKSILLEIQETLTRLKPFFHDIDKLIEQQDRPQHEKDMFIAQLKGAEAIVIKCERVKWNYYKRYKHACKLDKLNASLLRFCQIDVQFVMIRDMKETLVVVKDVQQRMEDKGSSSGWLSKVPVLDGFVIGFEDRVKERKKMVLKDSVVDDCSVVAVSAGGGYGKTTLVSKFCGDPDIQGKGKSFREFSESTQHVDQVKVNVTVNGHPIVDQLVKKTEKLAGPINPGDYWYDTRAGFWGTMGGHCRGIIPPFIEEFNYPMPEKCADGNTNVFVNGRELHQRDLDLLASRGLPTDTDRSYVIDISGRVLDEDSGQELEGLGKLAPTMESQKRGFGMTPPRTIDV